MFTRLLALVAASVFSLSVLAAPDAIFEGHDYTQIKNPQPVATGKKVEVLEFFWYRCPHCFQLEPSLSTWQKTLPKDAQMRRVPAVFREDWAAGAKTFYTLEQMGLLDRLHRKVFDAYHVENINLDDSALRGSWIAKQGVDRKKFDAVYNSFSTQSKMLKGSRLVSAYAITGVPAFIVDGKYATSMSMAQNEQRLYEILDQLIVKSRTERKAKGKTLGKDTGK